jgi:hypothetical protein
VEYNCTRGRCEILITESAVTNLVIFVMIGNFSSQWKARAGLVYQGRYFKTFKEPRNRFQEIVFDSLYVASAGRYGNLIPSRFLPPMNVLKFQLWQNKKPENDETRGHTRAQVPHATPF